VTEWGCMQALIDFDGWRKWKDYANEKESEDPAKKAAEEKEEKAKTKAALKAMFAKPPPSLKKDKDGGGGGERAPTSSGQNQTGTAAPKKPSSGAGRGHKSNKSGSTGANPTLESMIEVDEKGS